MPGADQFSEVELLALKRCAEEATCADVCAVKPSAATDVARDPTTEVCPLVSVLGAEQVHKKLSKRRGASAFAFIREGTHVSGQLYMW